MMDYKTLLVLAAVGLLISGAWMWQAGYGNSDAGHNMRWLECELDVELTDTGNNVLGQTAELDGGEWVLVGRQQMAAGFWIAVFGAWLFGAAWMQLSCSLRSDLPANAGSLRMRRGRHRRG